MKISFKNAYERKIDLDLRDVRFLIGRASAVEIKASTAEEVIWKKNGLSSINFFSFSLQMYFAAASRVG